MKKSTDIGLLICDKMKAHDKHDAAIFDMLASPRFKRIGEEKIEMIAGTQETIRHINFCINRGIDQKNAVAY